MTKSYFWKMKLLLLILLTVSTTALGQTTFQVQDVVTEKGIPFVKIYPNVGEPFLADIDGAFNIADSVDKFSIKAGGYPDTTIQKQLLTDTIIYLSLDVQLVDEIVVVPGENPAHPIMEKVIKNRKKNHPLKNDAFHYSSYNKFIFDIDRELLAQAPDSTSDSTILEIRAFFDTQHLFMLESTSERSFIPPYRDQEKITAYKVSGFHDPRFSTFANSMQSFSFYDNQFDLLGEPYINPIALGGINRYLFILEDTTFQDTDTTYTIYYRPRKGKRFNGLEGRMYINTNGYAIEKVTASPYTDTSGFSVSIIQQYEFVDGKKWFPKKLSTSINLGGLGGGSVQVEGPNYLSIIGTGQTYINDIQIDPENIKKIKKNNISIYTTEDAGDRSEQDWDSLRQYEINEREARTYEMIDSLSEAEDFEKKLAILSTLSTGKIPLGNYNLDIKRLFSFNYYERYRFGAGLETSKKVMKNATIGGYFAYGTLDKEWKYGGYSTIHLNRRTGTKLKFEYQQDVSERGGNTFKQTGLNLSSSNSYRFLFITNMDRQRLGQITLSTDLRANFTVDLIANYQRIGFTRGYQFSPDDANIYTNVNDVDLAETGIQIKWSILEKYMLLGDTKVGEGTKFPTIHFKLMRGWKGWFESNYDYYRLNATISQNFSFLGVGELQLFLEGGSTIGDVPLYLTQQSNGTGVPWLTSVSRSFETMPPGGFYNTEFIAFYTRFAFATLKTKAGWNEPKITLHNAFGYGTFNGRDQHNVPFQSMDKGYYEAGIIVDGMLTTGFIGLGLGVFYNYGYYALPDWKENVMPKLAVSFSL